MAHALAHPSRLHLDGNRIAGSTGAIAVNAAILLMLLAPMTVSQLTSPPTPEPPVAWIPREKVKPVPPIPVPVQQPRQVATPMPARQPQQRVAPLDPVLQQSLPGDTAVPPADPVDPVDASNTGGDIIGPPTPPLAGAHLSYASAPPPAYPREALRDGLTGTVILEVLVDVDGKPLDVQVVRSSGHRSLDQAARRQVLTRWLFQPALQNGRPVRALGRLPVEFRLNR